MLRIVMLIAVAIMVPSRSVPAVDFYVSDTVMLGPGLNPYLAVDPIRGSYHVAGEWSGQIRYASFNAKMEILEKADYVPQSDAHGGDGSGNCALAVSSSGEPTLIINQSVMNRATPCTSFAITRVNKVWQKRFAVAIAKDGSGEVTKGNRPWEHAAVGDKQGNVHTFMTLTSADYWEASPRIYTKLRGTQVVEQKNVVDEARAEGFNDMAVDSKGNLHFIWANSSSGVFYRKRTDATFSSPIQMPMPHSTRSSFGVAVTIDPQDRAHVLWQDSWDASIEYASDLYCARIEGGSVVDVYKLEDHSRRPLQSAMACDANGNLYVVYWSRIDTTMYLRYCEKATGKWSNRIDIGGVAPHSRAHCTIRAFGSRAAVVYTDRIHMVMRLICSDGKPPVGIGNVFRSFCRPAVSSTSEVSAYDVLGRVWQYRNGKIGYARQNTFTIQGKMPIIRAEDPRKRTR